MQRDEELRAVVADLIRILHEQAVDLVKLTDHLAQHVGKLPDGPDLSVVRSELTELHVRIKKLMEAERAGD